MNHQEMRYYLDGLKPAYTLKYITGEQYRQELTRLQQDSKDKLARIEEIMVRLEGGNDQAHNPNVD